MNSLSIDLSLLFLVIVGVQPHFLEHVEEVGEELLVRRLRLPGNPVNDPLVHAELYPVFTAQGDFVSPLLCARSLVECVQRFPQRLHHCAEGGSLRLVA